MTILQSEEEVGKEAEAIGGGDEVGVEPKAQGAKKKARPIYQNNQAVKMLEQLQKLPYMIWTYNL